MPAEEKCLAALAEVLNVLRSTNQYEKILHALVDRVVRVYRCQSCAIVLIDRKTEYLNIENSHGLSWTFCKDFRRRLATGPIGELLWTGKPIVLSTPVSSLADEVRLEHSFGSCALLQIAVDQRTLGYLYADSAVEGTFTDADIPILQAFATAAGLAVHKSLLYYENMHLDKTDHETGLEKYGFFMEKMRAGLEGAEKFDERFSVAILDVDNFKTLTHTYGFDASRAYLKELGEIVTRQLRSIDCAGRYGYDEVIIFLAKSGLQQAIQFSKTLASAVSGRLFTPHQIRSSVSIGLSVYPDNGRSIDVLVTAAKNALFEAQRSGRNKVFYCLSEWGSEQAMLCESNT